MIQFEIERKTSLGKLFEEVSGNNYSSELQIDLIRKLIFKQSNSMKFILSDFPYTLPEYQILEDKCCIIQKLLTFIKEDQKPVSFVDFLRPSLSPQSYYFSQGKHITINQNSIELLDGYIQEKKNYGFILGSAISNLKSLIAKNVEKNFEAKLIDFENLINMLKEKLGEEENPLEEVPFKEIVKVNLSFLKLKKIT